LTAPHKLPHRAAGATRFMGNNLATPAPLPSSASPSSSAATVSQGTMIQRRHKAEQELPLTSADTDPDGNKSKRSKRGRSRVGGDSPALVFQAFLAALVLIASLLGVSHMVRRRRHHHHHRHAAATDEQAAHAAGDDPSSPHLHHAQQHHHAHEPRRIHPLDGERHLHNADGEMGELPLAKFPSLTNAFAKSEIVGLYWAANWCPMSTPITEALDEAFSGKRNTLLYPDEMESYDAATEGRKQLSIVYISSDSSEEEMTDYIRGGWQSIPYDSTERTELKKHFRVCAKRELAELGFERKFEIPTLMILDGHTHGVISTNGVDDIREYGEKALTHWLGMQSLIRGLEDKYEGEALKNQAEPRIV